MLSALVFLMAPLLALVTAGVIAAARQPRAPRIPAVALVVSSTAVWLVYVGLFQHETPCGGESTCPTVYGYDAPLPDGHIVGVLLLLAGFAAPAMWIGWRRLVPPVTAGASLALGPTVLAWWTAPRGDNDGLWTLVFWFLPVLGGLAAIVAAVTERVGAARARRDSGPREHTNARPSDRLAALFLDAVIAGAGLTVPVLALSRAGLGVAAAVLGVAAATSYLAIPLAWKGRTLGQSIVGLVVLDTATNGRVPAWRAFARSFVVVLEVTAMPTVILAVPAFVDWMALALTDRTVLDRVLGTVVVSDRRPLVAPSSLEGVNPSWSNDQPGRAMTSR